MLFLVTRDPWPGERKRQGTKVFFFFSLEKKTPLVYIGCPSFCGTKTGDVT
jgi:hypothetical protein